MGILHFLLCCLCDGVTPGGGMSTDLSNNNTRLPRDNVTEEFS